MDKKDEKMEMEVKKWSHESCEETHGVMLVKKWTRKKRKKQFENGGQKLARMKTFR